MSNIIALTIVGRSLCITTSLIPVPAMLLYYKNIIVTLNFRTGFDWLANLLLYMLITYNIFKVFSM